jgi:DNA mismatch endonuclease (patch repair protein)
MPQSRGKRASKSVASRHSTKLIRLSERVKNSAPVFRGFRPKRPLYPPWAVRGRRLSAGYFFVKLPEGSETTPPDGIEHLELDSMTRTSYVTDEKTSQRMKRVLGADTTPEKVVRRALTRLRLRYSLHCRDLPGKPDIVFQGRKKVIFVHGCFWHRHKGCRRSSSPRKNISLWKEKFDRTVVRDRANVRRLRQMGWKVLVVWECQVNDDKRLAHRLFAFLER